MHWTGVLGFKSYNLKASCQEPCILKIKHSVTFSSRLASLARAASMRNFPSPFHHPPRAGLSSLRGLRALYQKLAISETAQDKTIIHLYLQIKQAKWVFGCRKSGLTQEVLILSQLRNSSIWDWPHFSQDGSSAAPDRPSQGRRHWRGFQWPGSLVRLCRYLARLGEGQSLRELQVE